MFRDLCSFLSSQAAIAGEDENERCSALESYLKSVDQNDKSTSINLAIAATWLIEHRSPFPDHKRRKLELLLKYGADPNHGNPNFVSLKFPNANLLHMAALNLNSQACRILVEHGAHVVSNHSLDDDIRPAELLVRCNDKHFEETLMVLFNAGAPMPRFEYCITTINVDEIFEDKWQRVKQCFDAVQRQRCMALAMGLHPRLGEISPVQNLNTDVLSVIFKHICA